MNPIKLSKMERSNLVDCFTNIVYNLRSIEEYQFSLKNKKCGYELSVTMKPIYNVEIFAVDLIFDEFSKRYEMIDNESY